MNLGMGATPAFRFSFDSYGIINEKRRVDEQKIVPETFAAQNVSETIFRFYGLSSVQRMRRRQNSSAAALSAQVMG